MTASLSQPTVAVKDPASARKRRRRAPTGGAADDCFACSKRNVKCDRRRPYCSQCLEVGNECSGYKTQLTWGVGVASRGKLRGLSLPIAKAPPVAREPKKLATTRDRSNSLASTSLSSTYWDDPDDMLQQTLPAAIDIPTPHSSYSNAGYDYISMAQPEQMNPHSLPPGSWGSVDYAASSLMRSPDNRITPKFSKFALPISTEGLSSSVDSLSEVDYLSPMSQGYSRDDMPPFSQSPPLGYDGFSIHHQASPMSHSPPTTLLIESNPMSSSCGGGLIYGGPSNSSSSHYPQLDHFESLHQLKSAANCDDPSVPDVDGGNCDAMPPGWQPHRVKEEDLPSPLSNLGNFWSSIREQPQLCIGPDVTAKMSFFMDYYKMTMAPSMVVIDTPQNPFKNHILQLASGSQSLQHAICALTACNLRMKRRLSLGQDTRELFEKLMAEKRATENAADAPPQDPSHAEEIQHRNLAVKLLNQQLGDAVKSSDDSVLATILILCHYRMAESGIAKFHTQFAGVKKILSMRSSRQFGGSRSDVAWMEMLFSYFDAISATINDREAQLTSVQDGFPAGMMPAGTINMVGCDGALIKTIGRLGRLNMLSQYRPVQNMAALATQGALGDGYDSGMGNVQSQICGAAELLYSTSPSHGFENNSFGSMLDDDELLTSAMSTSAALEDREVLFWAEWKEARQALQQWHFDMAGVASELPGGPNPSHLGDLESLSEAFRYAAMLYTERLASRDLPSSHTNFQNLVSQVVYYATSLKAGSCAEKFLLWPLFIAGSECVNELQQNIVRSKCKDIMMRSGYMNNLAALDVLERLWLGDFGNKGSGLSVSASVNMMYQQQQYDQQQSRIGGGGARGPFNWSKCFGGPGVGVEWIMF